MVTHTHHAASTNVERVYLQAMSQLAQALESLQLMATTAGIGQ